jgi:hypothetical protein
MSRRKRTRIGTSGDRSPYLLIRRFSFSSLLHIIDEENNLFKVSGKQHVSFEVILVHNAMESFQQKVPPILLGAFEDTGKSGYSDSPAIVIEFLGPGPSCSLLTKSGYSDIFGPDIVIVHL